jgi:PAS domain S-box-containing protein
LISCCAWFFEWKCSMVSPARSRPKAPLGVLAQAATESECRSAPESSEAADAPAAARGHRQIDPFAILTGVLSAGIGIVALAGPYSMGMAFTAALSFMGLGMGFVAMGLSWRVAALWMAVVVGLNNLALFVGHPAYGEPGLDARALSKWWPETPFNIYAMNPNAALGFFLVAVAVLLLTAGRNFRLRLTVIVLLGSAVVALGLYGIAGRLTGLQSAYGMGQLTGMVFPVACGLVLLGAGVLAESWRQGCYLPAERQLWILVVVAMTGIVTSTSLWRALMLVETLHFDSAHQLRSYTAGAVLILGLLATALLGAAVYLAQTAHLRVSVAERLRGEAEREAAQRKLADQSVARMNAYNRSLIEASIDPLVTIGADGKITDVNAATEAVTGLSRQELIGTDFCDYFTDPESARAGYRQVFREGHVHDYELEIRHSDGHIIPVLYNASVYHDQAGAVVGVFAAARDISERKRTEQALRCGAERYRALLAATAQVVWTTPPDGLVEDMPMWREYTGQTLEQVRGWGWLDAVHPDDRERTSAIWSQAVAERRIYETEYRIRRAGGEYRHFAIRGVPVLEEDGSIREWVGACTDIHERRQIEDELKKQAVLLNLAHDAILVSDLEYRIVFWNRGAEETYGWSVKEAVGRLAPELLHTEFPVPLPEIRAAVQQQGEWEGELKHTARDGRTMVVASRWSLQRDHHGAPANILEINRDITERRRLEEELRAGQAYTRSLIESSLDPLVTIAADGRITDVNRATEGVTGVSRAELVGSDFSTYFTEPEKARAGYRQVFAEGMVQDYPLAIRHRSGRVTDVLYNASLFRDQAGEVAGVFAAARDITERKRLEEELRARQAYTRSLIEASLDPLVTIAADGKITDVNRGTEEVTGIGRAQLIGSDFSTYFHRAGESARRLPAGVCRGHGAGLSVGHSPSFRPGDRCPLQRLPVPQPSRAGARRLRRRP